MTMRVLVCPDAFKGTLTAEAATDAIAAGLRRRHGADIEIDPAPMADGGPGTIAAIADPAAHRIDLKACDPSGKNVATHYLRREDGSVVIEMAQIAGLERVPADERDPMQATTLGVGELLLHAILMGASDILVGIGGSATNDGGAGFAQALGYRFLDRTGNDVETGRETGYGPLMIEELETIDPSGRHPGLASIRCRGLVDVLSPLTGPRGASRLYGPQKGASPEVARRLDAALAKLEEIIARDLGVAIGDLPGSGAGGGLGGAIVAFAGGELEPGAAFVAETIHLAERMRKADLVVTGEGRLDRQTREGKTVAHVGQLAKAAGKRAVAIVGALDTEPAAIEGLEKVIAASAGLDLQDDDLAARAATLLTDAASRVEV